MSGGRVDALGAWARRAAAHGNACVAWACPEDNLRLAQQRDDALYGWTAIFAALNLVDHHVRAVPLLLWQSLLHPIGDSPHCCSTGLVDHMITRLERNHTCEGDGRLVRDTTARLEHPQGRQGGGGEETGNNLSPNAALTRTQAAANRCPKPTPSHRPPPCVARGRRGRARVAWSLERAVCGHGGGGILPRGGRPADFFQCTPKRDRVTNFMTLTRNIHDRITVEKKNDERKCPCRVCPSC